MPFFFFFLLLTPAGIPPPPPPPPPPRIGQFKPGIAVIVALLTTIFSVTFLLLLYMKHCKREAYVVGNTTTSSSSYYQTAPLGRNSGVDRKVIESLPMFRFSSLTGQKDGLECAVCLNRFDPDEVLRLLPKCKHAFHVECVDTWLDAHSTCPLCRYRVDPEDVLLLDSRIPYNPTAAATPRSSNQGKEYTIPRISGRHSSAGERGTPALEIISENPPPGHDLRGRISLDSWHTTRRKSGKGNPKPQNPDRHHGTLSRKTRKDGQLLGAQKENHRRLEHRIVISSGTDLEGGRTEESRRRWSDAQAAEILYLKSEMMMISGRGVNNERSVSEITGVSRYVCNNGGGKQQVQEEERAVRRWLDWISSQSHSLPISSSSSSSSSAL